METIHSFNHFLVHLTISSIICVILCVCDRWHYLNELLPEEVLPEGVPPEAGQQSESLLPVQQLAPHPVHVVPVYSWTCGNFGCIIHCRGQH
jgi:hypothetical protein